MRSIGDFFITFLIDFVFRRFFMIPLVAFYALYRADMLPLWPMWATLGAWVLTSLIRTLVVMIVGRVASGSRVLNPSSRNVNPYSRTTSDYLPRYEEERNT